MTATISIEFAWPRPGKSSLVECATLRLEGEAMGTCQWSVERIDGDASNPEEHARMEVWLREDDDKRKQIERKFRERIHGVRAWAA